MNRYQPDRAGAQAAIRISKQIEPWGDARFPVDVDLLALNCAQTYGWPDPITQVHGEAWDGIEGALLPGAEGREWWIVYNTRSTLERQRFTKAHELGHYIMHRREHGDTPIRSFECGNDSIWERDSGKPDLEAQANQFASYLLMPANHLRERLGHQRVTFEVLGDLADFYGVSLEAICLKFVEMTDRRAVIIKWDNGYLKWCVPSRKARLTRARYPRSNTLIEPPPGSLAADEGVRQEWKGQRVPAQTWFHTESPKALLREMKHVSDTYERVLSLLILPEAEAPWEREDEDEDD
jgi:hypothetical protein